MHYFLLFYQINLNKVCTKEKLYSFIIQLLSDLCNTFDKIKFMEYNTLDRIGRLRDNTERCVMRKVRAPYGKDSR